MGAGAFLCGKVGKRILFRAKLWAPGGGAGPFARHDEHRCRGGQIGSRLRRRGAFYKRIICMPTRRGPTFVCTKVGKTHLGLRPKTPLPLSYGWIRTMLWHRSYGAADTLSRCLRRILFGFSRDQIKNQPYKRRRVGRNLRLSRTDPTLCFGQPSPLRCILLSPQGFATLRGPQFYGVYRRVGGLGALPE